MTSVPRIDCLSGADLQKYLNAAGSNLESFMQICASTTLGVGSKEIAISGGVLTIMEVLREHLRNRRIQRLGYDALRVLVELGVDSSTKSTLTGCVGQVIESMALHPVDAKLQQYACQVLNHVSQFGVISIWRVVATGGIPAILRAMRQHPDDVEVQVAGCAALEQFLLQGWTDLLSQAGAVEVVLVSLQTHPHHVKLHTRVSSFLVSFITGTEKEAQHVQDLGAIEILLAAMPRLKKDTTALTGCFSVILLLVDSAAKADPSNLVTTIIRVDGARTVAKVMLDHPEDLPLQQLGCALLWRLAGPKATRRQVVTAGGKEAVTMALKLHTGDSKVDRFGGLAMKKIGTTRQLRIPNLLAIGRARKTKAQGEPSKEEKRPSLWPPMFSCFRPSH